MVIKVRHIVLQLLLPLIVIFQFGQANFIHFHVSENGKVIAHSHPYQIQDNEEEGKPSPGHHHSNSELALLQFIDGIFVDDCEEVIYVHKKETEYSIPKLQFQNSYASINSWNNRLLRGPPLHLSFS